jgi:uncharacterized coiled-coil protein SlyX
MSHDERHSDLHQRLDDLEKRLAEKEAEIGRTGPVPSHHREHIDEIAARARAIRQKLQKPEESTWEAVKHEAEVDWQALANAFELWVDHVDEDYRHRES